MHVLQEIMALTLTLFYVLCEQNLTYIFFEGYDIIFCSDYLIRSMHFWQTAYYYAILRLRLPTTFRDAILSMLIRANSILGLVLWLMTFR